MRKKCFSLILLITIIFTSISIIYAADNIFERPEIKINIDGRINTYTDVPIIVNGRSLLPLRAILINLGVQNDKEHISWNELDKSVTILKDTKKIHLEVGSKTANVEDVQVDLDTPPVIYKNRVYIPARFIAQSLGKKVAWDASLNMVLLRDENEFNEVKSILEKTEAAMNSVNKYKSVKSGFLSVDRDKLKLTYDIRVSDQVDIKNKEWYGEAKKTEVTPDGKSTTINLQFFMKNNTTYARIPPGEKWEKTEVKTEEEYNVYLMKYTIKPDDINCAGLISENSADTNEILLKGKINLDDPLNSFMNLVGIDEYTLRDANVEISINKNTYLVNKVNLEIDGDIHSQTGGEMFAAELNYVFNEYNGNFEVVLPDGVE